MKPSWREQLNISRVAIKYARVTVFIAIAVAVAGIFAFSSLKYALFPEIPFPVVIVQGSAPLETTLETEKQLTNPLETSLRSLENAELFSSTYPGQTIINVAFAAGLNLDQSTTTVKNYLKQASLPPEATIEVTPFNPNESVAVTYAISSETQPVDLLASITQEQIIPSLEAVPGVRRVDLLGDSSLRDTDNNSSAANPPTLTRLNQEDILAVQVIKKAEGNTLDVAAAVEEQIANLRENLPNIRLVIAETQADYIEEASQATLEALLGAIVLAILVIFPFLGNIQATLITALAIPMSLLGTFIVMAVAGFNLETITLLGLALVIGIIVDDAIVDVENISRHIDEGMSPKQAAIKGTDEIGLTVSASTLTLATVFLPIALIGGNLGQFFKPFGMTVSAAVLISLLVARTLSPVLAMYWIKPRRRKSENKQKSFILVPIYRSILNWSLYHRKAVMTIALLSFVVGLGLIPFIPQGFVPKLDRGEFNVIYTLPNPKVTNRLKVPQTSDSDNNNPSLFQGFMDSPERFLLGRNYRVGSKLEGLILEDTNNVESAYTIAGYQGNPLKGRIYVQLKDNRSLTTSQVQEKIREKLPKLKGGSISVEDILFIETGDDSPFKIALLSNSLDSLTKTANLLKNRLESIPGLVDIKLSAGKKNAPIEHFEQQRVIYLTANLSEGIGLGDVTKEVVEIAQEMLPNDVTFDIQGASAQVQSIFKEFAIALFFAILSMMVILYLTFGRFLESFVVLLSLPLSIVGAMFALLITQSDFGMISLIGLIFLLGLLDKNAILLMDYTNQLREQGMSRHHAILKTGEIRLRPIIMTTASTILGMLPIAVGLGAGAELRQPMAVAIIGGLITSSVLSLIVVPVLYTLLEDAGEKLFFSKMKRVDN
ncbi:MAG: efflux RND transporter permease subunit [Crocosphaera sp.]|uniref:efflux RND transporter permease subunit n=1 Tax=Crocosphaera sp. TaxID=2729996 RepID=UPI002582B3FB|nr:efflux RND transporter permease subunit [Crocosphaera sp.]MCH2246132.1 efflux RND transporter permease subunit [Crocosphaera sp.]